jgi:hypothetical protein
MTLRETTKYVSLTNKGYIDYTHNLLSSIKENQIDIDLTIYSLDKDSYNYFSKKNISTKLIDTDASKINFSKFELQNSSEFYKIVYFKFYCINDLLQTNNYVHFLDGDIVIKKDFSNEILKYGENIELLAQSNKSPHDSNDEEINSGFMLFNSTKKIKKYINPKRFSLKKFSKFKFHDQTYINNIKNRIDYKLLNLDDFPNGAHFKKYKDSIDPFIIHYNYILGHEKKNEMIKDNNWYL